MEQHKLDWLSRRSATPTVAAFSCLVFCSLLFTGKNAVASDEASCLSTRGVYQASYRSDLLPIRINHIHAWVLHLATFDGQPVTDAEIGITGGMPQHNHGLPTQPQVTENLGNGD